MTIAIRRPNFGPNLSSVMAWHPEWWMLMLCGVAWYFILVPLEQSRSCCQIAVNSSGCWLVPPNASELLDWMIMTGAMMLPMTLVSVRAAAFGSLWKRRHWAIAGFLVGYLAVWLAAGCISLQLIHALASIPGQYMHWIAGATFAVSAGWQCTQLKARLASSCHRTQPLAPFGWPAHRDCLWFGIWHGVHCVASCGIVMIAAMLSPWHTTLMVVLTGLLLFDRYSRRGQSRLVATSFCAMAIVHCLP